MMGLLNLNLDFIHRSNRLRKVVAVMLACGIIAMLYLGYAYWKSSAEFEHWQAKWRSVQNKQSRSIASTVQSSGAEQIQVQAELQYASQVSDRLSLAWDGLFDDIDMSAGEGVSLLEVGPDPQKREVQIVAEAKNLEAMLAYVVRLQSAKTFHDAHIVSHQIQQQDAQKPVRFVVRVRWLPKSACAILCFNY